jgi:D-alanyl-D-alanine carboxypeptidase
MEPNLRDEILKALKRLGVPGAIVSIKSETYGPLDLYYGYANLARKVRMKDAKDLRFKIGSITKTFTGTMLLQLLDEGKVDLDESIDHYIQGVPNGKNITLRQVGNMRSGIFNYSENSVIDQLISSEPDRVWSPSELIAVGVTTKPYFPPGTGFHYSNTDAIILGVIIERLNPSDGKHGDYEHELYSRMLGPLKLDHTRIKPVIQDPCIHGYLRKPDGEYQDITTYNDSWGWSAGQMVSNVSDLHRYLRLSVASHVTISSCAVKEQRKWASQVVRNGINFEYGFMMEKLDDYIGHNGSILGFSIYVAVNQKTKTTVVVMCNIQTSLDNRSPADVITDLIVKTLP